MRKCVVTGEMQPKKSLVRIVKNKENVLSIDPKGKAPGRGAYITLDVEVAKEALRKRSFEKAFSMKVPDEFYQEVIDYVEHLQIRNELFADERLFKN